MELVPGNRGKCAQACRLPYEIITDDNALLDKGYLLSPRDLCSLEYLPDLLQTGVTSLKLEGRLKTPEYVAVVTRIYRKYLDLALSNQDYVVEEEDKKDLMQVFNRGGFSSGHLTSSANKNLIFQEKPNNMGIYIGNIASYQANKGYITVNLNNPLALGDTISVERENSKYRVSELMLNKQNIKEAQASMEVTIGRVKGEIRPGDKIYKLDNKALSLLAKDSYLQVEHRKNRLDCKLEIHKNQPIVAQITDEHAVSVHIVSNVYPSNAITNPITKERIILQFCKTASTPFEFETFHIDLDDNLYLNISDINELRRSCLAQLEETILANHKRTLEKKINKLSYSTAPIKPKKKKISLLLNNLDTNANYSTLHEVERIYLPVRFFGNPKYANIVKTLSVSYNLYIYVSNIIKPNYKNLLMTIIDKTLETYDIKGFVVSNISLFELLKDYHKNYKFIGDYTLNVFNDVSAKYYENAGLDCVTLSCELSKKNLLCLCNTIPMQKELLVYGNVPVMTCSYCFLGKSNKCYPECPAYCQKNQKYYLRDKMGYEFRIVPDNIKNISILYNSKITSIDFHDFNIDYARIHILDENLYEINNIIDTVRAEKKFSGKNYTNGNLNREV